MAVFALCIFISYITKAELHKTPQLNKHIIYVHNTTNYQPMTFTVCGLNLLHDLLNPDTRFTWNPLMKVEHYRDTRICTSVGHSG